MCVIAVYKSQKDINFRDMESMFRANPHGSGYMYLDGMKVIIEKPFFSVGELALDISTRHISGPVVVHHRISTGGELDKLCTHPHRVNERLAIAHNGILPIPATDDKSDTVFFTEMIRAMEPKHLSTFRHLLTDICGDRNKIVFLSPEERVVTYGRWFQFKKNVLVSNLRFSSRGAF